MKYSLSAKVHQHPNLLYDQQASTRVETPENPSTQFDHENTMFWLDLLEEKGSHSSIETGSTNGKKKERQDPPKIKEPTHFQNIEQDINEEDIWDFVDQLPKYKKEDNDNLDYVRTMNDEKSSSSIQSTDSAREKPEETTGKPQKKMSQGEKEWNRLFGITPIEVDPVVTGKDELLSRDGSLDLLDKRRECFAAINIMDNTSLMGTMLDDTIIPKPSPVKRKSDSTGGTGVR